MRGRCRRAQGGFTLVELLVGLGVSMVVLAGVLSIMVRIGVEGGQTLQTARLGNELREVLDFAARDLQRAGYVAWEQRCGLGAGGSSALAIDEFYECAIPAMDDFGQVELFDYDPRDPTASPTACSSGCSCVLYRYDLNGDGQFGNGNFEAFGLRRNGERLEVRAAGGGHACDSGTWVPAHGADLAVTNLAFDLVYASAAGASSHAGAFALASSGGTWSAGSTAASCDPTPDDAADPLPDSVGDQVCLWRRSVGISVAARLPGDPAVTAALATRVRLANDFFDGIDNDG
jgi:type II secretory pathway component PulJ